MATNWKYANVVEQYAEDDAHISWANESTGFHQIKSNDQTFLSTTSDLLFIANPTVNNLRMKTYYLYLTDFKFTDLPDVITGLEVEVSVRRGGRITDDTIQLLHDGVFIGDNKASLSLEVKQIYGSSTDTWYDGLTKQMIESNTFGVGLRYQSHPEWPHRESPKVDYVRVRVW